MPAAAGWRALKGQGKLICHGTGLKYRRGHTQFYVVRDEAFFPPAALPEPPPAEPRPNNNESHHTTTKPHHRSGGAFIAAAPLPRASSRAGRPGSFCGNYGVTPPPPIHTPDNPVHDPLRKKTSRPSRFVCSCASVNVERKSHKDSLVSTDTRDYLLARSNTDGFA